MSKQLVGVIMRGIGSFYTVRAEDGAEYTLRAQGKLRHEHITPTVGDSVRFEMPENQAEGWILEILPRKNLLIRPSVANIDEIVLMAPAASPDADPLLIDRMLLYAQKLGLSASICVSKADLAPETAKDLLLQYENSGASVFLTSAETGEGLNALKERLKGKTHAFSGQSGAGKSSVINALYGLKLETGCVSEKILRGKHTTRRCELIPVSGGGRVLDTPGFSLLETELMEPKDLSLLYPEFAPYREKCRFSPCYHEKEPDCEVLKALREGKISQKRYERYLMLLSEMKERWKNRYDSRSTLHTGR